jgi:hypothetical protein
MRLGAFVLTFAALLFSAFSLLEVPGNWDPQPAGKATNLVGSECLELTYDPSDPRLPARIQLDTVVFFNRDSTVWYEAFANGDVGPIDYPTAAWALAGLDSIDITIRGTFVLRLPKRAESGHGRVIWQSHVNIFAAMVEPDFSAAFTKRACQGGFSRPAV